MSRFAIVTAFGSLMLAAFVACSDSGAGSSPAPNGDEGGTVPPPAEAGPAEDAGADADAEVPDAAPRECSKEGFCHTVVPPHQTLKAVWSDGAGTTWAASEEGGLLRYDGKTWSVHTTLTGALWSIWGSSPTDIWIGGDVGLFHSAGATSATLTFTQVSLPGASTPITSVWGTGANDVWATGGNDFPMEARVLHYTGGVGKDDAGPDFALEGVTNDGVKFVRVFGSQASGVWVAGFWFNKAMGGRREPRLLRRSVGASGYVDVALPSDPSAGGQRYGDLQNFYDASMSSDGLSVYVLSRTHSAQPAFVWGVSSDGGQTFTWNFRATSDNRDPLLNAIGATSSNDIWIAGNYGRLQHWNGTKWKQAVTTVTKYPLIDPLYAMGGVGNDLWFVGEGIALHRDPSKIEP